MRGASLDLHIFLSRTRAIVGDLRRLRFVDREKSRDTLDRYRLTVSGLCSRLAKLKPENFVKGSEPDNDGSDGSIWVFYHGVFGTRIYLKLML